MTPVKSALKMPLDSRANGHLMAVCDLRMECGNKGTLQIVRKSKCKKKKKRVVFPLHMCLFVVLCRTTLPAPMFSRHDFSIWGFLKKCIGMVGKMNFVNNEDHVVSITMAKTNNRNGSQWSCLITLFFSVQELSKITMPVVFNEPLSFLQRLTEYMEHTYLIHRACTLSDSIERMQVSVVYCKLLSSD